MRRRDDFALSLYPEKRWENGAAYLYDDNPGDYVPEVVYHGREFTFLGKSTGARGFIFPAAPDSEGE